MPNLIRVSILSVSPEIGGKLLKQKVKSIEDNIIVAAKKHNLSLNDLTRYVGFSIQTKEAEICATTPEVLARKLKVEAPAASKIAAPAAPKVEAPAAPKEKSISQLNKAELYTALKALGKKEASLDKLKNKQLQGMLRELTKDIASTK